MIDLIRRLVKGSPLTAEDHDGNLDALEAAIERPRAGGGLYWNGNETATVVVLTETYYSVVVPSTETGTEVGVTVGSGTLTVDDETERTYLVTASACIALNEQNKQVRMRITLNGDDLDQTCAQSSVTGTPGSGRRINLATHTRLRLSAGDVVGLAVGNWTDTADILVRNAQLSITEA
jgi:hypothetical protein